MSHKPPIDPGQGQPPHEIPCDRGKGRPDEVPPRPVTPPRTHGGISSAQPFVPSSYLASPHLEADTLSMRAYPDWELVPAWWPYWTGTVTPIPETDDWPSVVYAILNRYSVYVGTSGRIIPARRVSRSALPAELRQLHNMDTTFRLRAYMDAGEAHPTVVAVDPRIAHDTHPGHPHLYLAHSRLYDMCPICPLFPPDSDWSRPHSTLADYLDRVALWLVAHLVWVQTGRWIAAEAHHHPLWHLLNVGEKQQCPCGSGRPYGLCCQADEATFVNSTLGPAVGQRRAKLE